MKNKQGQRQGIRWGKGQIPTHSSITINSHSFKIICILELVFIELVFGIVLNMNCIVICIVLCCLMNVYVLFFVNVPYIYKKGICICVYIYVII